MRILVVIFFCLLIYCCKAEQHHGLLVLLLDGFRWDYIDKPADNLNTFHFLKSNGSYVKRVQPVFPADCFPNIYSLFTGLYPSSHGVVGNRVYDIGKKQYFDHFNHSHVDYDIGLWLDSEPIWVTAKKQNKGVFLYNSPTCSRNSNMSPHYCVPYSKNRRSFKEFRASIRQAMNVLLMQSANIAVVYDDQIDFLTHKYGPNSHILRSEFLPQLDRVLEEIVNELNSEPNNQIHLMVLSDHGMSQMSTTRSIYLDSIIQRYHIEYMINNGATVNIWPKRGFYQQVLNSIVAFNDPNLILYEKDKIPHTWNIRDHKRTPPILLVAKPGYFIESSKLEYPHYDNIPMDGFHGYPPDSQDMHTPFFFFGPKSAKNVTLESVNIVDLYQLMCHVIELNATSHNGTWSNVSPLLDGHSPFSSTIAKDTRLKYHPVLPPHVNDKTELSAATNISNVKLIFLCVTFLIHYLLIS